MSRSRLIVLPPGPMMRRASLFVTAKPNSEGGALRLGALAAGTTSHWDTAACAERLAGSFETPHLRFPCMTRDAAT